MDIYAQIQDYMFNFPVLSTWPDMQTVFKKMATGKPRHWTLPGAACESLGGAIDQAISSIAAMSCLHISIILIDDMLDNDPRGEYLRLGGPAAANLATAFQSAGFEAIVRSNFEPWAKLAAFENLSTMLQSTAMGQSLDTLNISDETSYWSIIQAKSSPYFGSAFYVGALAGGASIDVAELFGHLGCLYGESIQIHDDLSDAFAVPANPDWFEGRLSLPILFAQIVNHPERERFLSLRSDMNVQGNLAKAQAILVRCGAVSYCIDCILQKYKEAMSLLKDLPLQNETVLKEVVDSQILPVQELLKGIGISYSFSLPKD